MSLIEELQVSLKDFLPGTRLVTGNIGPIAMVSDRLFLKLQTYSRLRGISVAAAIEQLRDEVQRLT
jgi:hypothetical protein